MASQTLTGTQFADIEGISQFQTKLHWIGSYELLSQDPVANTSKLRLYGSIYLRNTSSQTYTSYGWDEVFKVAGTTIKTGSYTFYTPADNGYTLWGYTDRTVTHNSDGTFPTQTYSIYASSGHFNYGNGQTAYGDISGIASIDRTAATPTITVSSISANSFSLAVSTNANCNKFEYSLNGGSTWTTFSTTNGTSASVSVTGLSPATTYSLVVRVTKTYNEITSTASQSVATLGFSVITDVKSMGRNDFIVDANVQVSYTVYSTGFYHKLEITPAGGTKTTETLGTASSTGSKVYTTTYDFPASISPNATSNSVLFELITYTSSSYTTEIGRSSVRYNVTVPDSSTYQPSLTYALSDYNTNAWLSSNHLYVGGFSAINVAVTPSAGSGASIADVSLTNVEYTTVSANNFRTVILPSGTANFNIVVTDSRGRSKTVAVSQSLLYYAAPSLYLTSQRGTYSGGTWTANESGAHVRITLSASCSLSAQGNTLTNTVKVVVGGSEVAPAATSGNYYYFTNTSADVSYLFNGTSTDSVGTVSTTSLTVSSVSVPMNLNAELPSIGFGKVAETSKTVEIASDWDLVVGGDESVSGELTVNDLTVTGDVSVADVTVANLTATGDVSVTGDVSADDVSVGGALSVGSASLPDSNNSGKYLKMNSSGTALEWGTPQSTPMSEILDAVYPVGSIYMSVNNTSPATLFGGTWSALQDRFLLGAGSTYTAGDTGGAATHTLTTDEMPSHNHVVTRATTSYGSGQQSAWRALSWSGTNHDYSDVVSSESTGSGQAHNNLPPYLVVYMWKRTA